MCSSDLLGAVAVELGVVAIPPLTARLGDVHRDIGVLDQRGRARAVLRVHGDADARAEVSAQLADKLAFVGDAPVLKISAKSGKGVHKLLPVLQEAIEQNHKRGPTKDVNRVIATRQP